VKASHRGGRAAAPRKTMTGAAAPGGRGDKRPGSCGGRSDHRPGQTQGDPRGPQHWLVPRPVSATRQTV
jgi:hypothetical protein